MASAARPLYNFLFRRNYVFLGAIFAGAFGFEIAYDTVTDKIWDSINKGVCVIQMSLLRIWTNANDSDNGRIFGRDISRMRAETTMNRGLDFEGREGK
ncbi:hypothetical protein L207DRAFT_194316 [Hyaloscypha variabilis F]|uniref:Complex III subunit 9 n=1 Tax=Hyaloscypha variabilis (strain UAMH 11265 / GT02V1 / F) TaxID=1149755 RepID=A0A2J6QYD9_HYAVF|nr:hypothetical protein L207DRAFT_194316 [Hyaloscypha variabilis F]